MGSLLGHAVVSGWTWQPVWDALIALTALAYLLGVVRTRRAGARWPPVRTLALSSGVVALILAVDSGIGRYARMVSTVHMVQHLLLIMVVPMCWVAARPWQLCYDSGRMGRRFVERFRRAKVVGWLLAPVFGTACYTLVLVGTHLTPFMRLAAVAPGAHIVEEVLYLVSGYMFLLPLAGYEPLRSHLAYPIRVVVLLASMIVDTVVGITLMMSSTPMTAGMGQIAGLRLSPLQDLRWAGAVMWVVGDGLMMLIVLLVAARWSTDTERQNDTGRWLEAARRDALSRIAGQPRAEDGFADSDLEADEQALAAYNRMLARLADHERHSDQESSAH